MVDPVTFPLELEKEVLQDLLFYFIRFAIVVSVAIASLLAVMCILYSLVCANTDGGGETKDARKNQ